MQTIGELIIEEIIKGNMFRIEREGDNHIIVWNGNAGEQLEALVETHYTKK